MSRLGPKLVSEGIGTFAILFFGCGAVMVCERFPGVLPAAAVSPVFGLIVAAMIYALGHVSGAHFNPAVTLAFATTGHFPKREVIPYWIAQALGGIAAVGTLSLLLPPGQAFGATVPAVSAAQALGWEIVLSFFLMFVVMGVATDSRAEGAMAGVAVGATVTLSAYVGGPVTGASMNPARSLAPALFQGTMDSMWIYILGPMIGTILAGLIYQSLRSGSELAVKSSTP